MIQYFNKLSENLPQVPSSLAGLALAIGSLVKCWETAINQDGALAILGAAISLMLLLPICLKYVLNLNLLIQDLKHPLAGSILPTLPMALMVLASNLKSLSLQGSIWLSWFAISLHFVFFIYFTVYRYRHFQFKQILPSWFIPPIGLVLPILTHPGGLPIKLAEFLLFLGLISYAILLPVVIVRLIFSSPLTALEKPIIVILATPASLLLLGYFAITEQTNFAFIFLLFFVAVSMTLYTYYSLTKLIKIPFVLTYPAFTFPLVASAMALFRMSDFLINESFPQLWINITLAFANIALIIATFMVSVVSHRFYGYFNRSATSQMP